MVAGTATYRVAPALKEIGGHRVKGIHARCRTAGGARIYTHMCDAHSVVGGLAVSAGTGSSTNTSTCRVAGHEMAPQIDLLGGLLCFPIESVIFIFQVNLYLITVSQIGL